MVIDKLRNALGKKQERQRDEACLEHCRQCDGHCPLVDGCC